MRAGPGVEHILELLDEAVVLARLDGSIVAANEAASRTFGRTREELSALAQDDLLGAQSLAAPDRWAMMPMRLRRADGSTFQAQVRAAQLPGPDGAPEIWIVVRDLEAEHRAEVASARFRAARSQHFSRAFRGLRAACAA